MSRNPVFHAPVLPGTLQILDLLLVSSLRIKNSYELIAIDAI
jgi:hypothetical protein